MRKLILIIIVLAFASCQQSVEPTVENINSIFQTKDFSVEFLSDDEQSYRLSFRDDYMSFHSEAETQRKTISYDEAIAVNDFVQQLFSRKTTDTNHKVIIYNDSRSVAFETTDFEKSLKNLITNLQLEYVSH